MTHKPSWEDYVKRFMKNARVENLADGSIVVHASQAVIGRWENNAGFVVERRSQHWLWNCLISYHSVDRSEGSDDRRI